MILKYLALFICPLIIVSLLIRKIIFISNKKNLYDDPSEDRKVHLTRTPNLGGVGIFSATVLTSLLFLPETGTPHFNYLLVSGIIIFALGLTDDLVGTRPDIKIIAQLVAALITTLVSDIHFTSLYGFFGIDDIPYTAGILLTVLFILLIINAFNLIDGINCLAGSIALLAFLTFAFCFWKMNDSVYAMLSVILAGSLAGFLLYNRTPARIFMGDTGSLFLGFVVAVFSIRFVELNKINPVNNLQPLFQSAPAIVLGLLVIPVFDTIRVFILRLLKGKSPFLADRNHIHHRFIDLNFSHLQATAIIVLVNLAMLVIAFFLQSVNSGIVLITFVVLMLSLNRVLSFAFYRKTGKLIPNTKKHPQSELAAL